MSIARRVIIGLLIFVGGLAVVGAAGYYGFVSRRTAPEPIAAPPTIPLTRGDVDLTVIAPGTLVAAETQIVRTNVEGQITTLTVQPGDTVRADDVLATLDSAPLEDRLADAQRAVTQAEEVISTGITSAEDALTEAEANLTNLQLEYPTIDQARLDLDQARVSLSHARRALDQANAALPETQTELSNAKQGVDNTAANLDIANTNRAHVKQALTNARNEQRSAEAHRNTAQAAQIAAQQAYQDAVAGGASQEVTDSLKAQLDTANVTLAGAETALTSANHTLEDAQDTFQEADAAYQTRLSEQSQAQSQYEQAKSAVEQAAAQVEQAQTGVHNTEFAVRQAELTMQEAKRQQDIAAQRLISAEYAVEQARASLENARSRTLDPDLVQAVEEAQAALDAATIRAPINGQVQAVMHEAGAIIERGEAILTLINPTRLEVAATVIEEDLPLVKVGQHADLFLDAAPEAVISGRVGRIVPERIAGSDRPIYTVHITLDGILPEGLLPGMNAESMILVDQRTGVLILPRAVVRARSDGTAEIDVWSGSALEPRAVQVGLRGDVYVEILSGIEEGELVVAE